MVDGDAAHEPEPQYEVDPDLLAGVLARARAGQSLGGAIAGGVVGAVIGAVGWAAITVAADRQIGFMAIGVGLLVGFGGSRLGRGIDLSFAVVAAVLSLVGVMLGNFLAVCGLVAKEEGLPFSQVLTDLGIAHPLELMKATFQPMDLLFYALAVYAGWRVGRRGLTPEEIRGALKPVEREEPKPPAD